jgi:hypothetical protein
MYTLQDNDNASKNVENHYKDTNQTIDPIMFQQIEAMIQNQYNLTVPALLIEYKLTEENSKDFTGWDREDLQEFFSHFGNIEVLEVYGKIAVILFKTFVDAYTCQEFLLNSNNFKDSEKNKFNTRWYSQEDEHYISDNLKNKIKMHIATWNGYNNYYNNFPRQQQYVTNKYNEIPANKSINNSSRYSSYSGQNYTTYSQNTRLEYNDENQNYLNESYLQNGKYTCKFEISIENDNDFQVARRVIGSKVI